MPETIVGVLYIFIYISLIFIAVLKYEYCCGPCFTNMETELQRDNLSCPAHRQAQASLIPEPTLQPLSNRDYAMLYSMENITICWFYMHLIQINCDGPVLKAIICFSVCLFITAFISQHYILFACNKNDWLVGVFFKFLYRDHCK